MSKQPNQGTITYRQIGVGKTNVLDSDDTVVCVLHRKNGSLNFFVQDPGQYFGLTNFKLDKINGPAAADPNVYCTAYSQEPDDLATGTYHEITMNGMIGWVIRQESQDAWRDVWAFKPGLPDRQPGDPKAVVTMKDRQVPLPTDPSYVYHVDTCQK